MGNYKYIQLLNIQTDPSSKKIAQFIAEIFLVIKSRIPSLVHKIY